MSRILIKCFEKQCNINYHFLAMNLDVVYNSIAVQTVRSPYPPSSTKSLSLLFACFLEEYPVHFQRQILTISDT
jgi:hypothetical protein